MARNVGSETFPQGEISSVVRIRTINQIAFGHVRWGREPWVVAFLDRSEVAELVRTCQRLTTDNCFLLLFPAPTFVPIDSQGLSVLVWGYTGKEVV
jgi:hypothetical protein